MYRMPWTSDIQIGGLEEAEQYSNVILLMTGLFLQEFVKISFMQGNGWDLCHVQGRIKTSVAAVTLEFLLQTWQTEYCIDAFIDICGAVHMLRSKVCIKTLQVDERCCSKSHCCVSSHKVMSQNSALPFQWPCTFRNSGWCNCKEWASSGI
jgi:hypothetical protein